MLELEEDDNPSTSDMVVFALRYVVVVNHVTIVAIGHGLLLKKFWPMVIGCVQRTAGSSIIRTTLLDGERGPTNCYSLYRPLSACLSKSQISN